MPYHHGRLREALIDAGVMLARRGGPDAVGVRAAARSAGVSHNAAYRHFADLDDFLAAVCAQCMHRLAERMQASLRAVPFGGDPEAAVARLTAIGRDYVDFALEEPGWFRTAFGVPAGQPPGWASDTPGPYELLGAVLDELVVAGAMSADDRPGAEYAAWSAVHGIATLVLDGPLRALAPAERRRAIARVLDDASSSAVARRVR